MRTAFAPFVVTFLSALQAAPAFAGNILLAQSGNREKCVQGCQAENRRNVTTCDTFKPPRSQVEAHRACLDKARNTFDSCMTTCR
jgi:hypothetical protein